MWQFQIDIFMKCRPTFTLAGLERWYPATAWTEFSPGSEAEGLMRLKICLQHEADNLKYEMGILGENGLLQH